MVGRKGKEVLRRGRKVGSFFLFTSWVICCVSAVAAFGSESPPHIIAAGGEEEVAVPASLLANTNTCVFYPSPPRPLDQLRPVRGVTREWCGRSISFGGESVSGFRSHIWKKNLPCESAKKLGGSSGQGDRAARDCDSVNSAWKQRVGRKRDFF